MKNDTQNMYHKHHKVHNLVFIASHSFLTLDWGGYIGETFVGLNTVYFSAVLSFYHTCLYFIVLFLMHFVENDLSGETEFPPGL